MCWMDIRRGGDALAESIENTRRQEHRNGHSWGWAAVVDGEIVINRGVGTFPDDDGVPFAEAAMSHTRFATRGSITRENSHPFPVRRGGETVAALAHNGTWIDAPNVPGWSDTRVMADILSRMLEENPWMDFDQAFAGLARMTGETIIALHRDGTCHVHSGRFSITRDGAVVSSSGHAPLPDGLHIMEPGDELSPKNAGFLTGSETAP